MTPDEARPIMTQTLAQMGMRHDDPSLYLDLEVFGEFIYRALAIANPEYDVTFAPPVTVRIAPKDGTDGTRVLNCSRPFKRFSGLDLSLNAGILLDIIASFQGHVAAAPFKDTPDYSLVVPLLKSTDMHARSQARNEALAEKDGRDKALSRYLSWDVTDGVVALLALNEPTRFQFVTEGMLQKSGLSFDALKALALTNLAAHYQHAKVATEYTSGMAEVTGTGCAASSFILLEEFLEQEATNAEEDVLHIFSSATDHLVIMPGSNAAGISSVLAALRLGALPSGDIPPLVYADGSLRELATEDIAKILSSIDEGPTPPRRPWM
jgi:hypothetical protein